MPAKGSALKGALAAGPRGRVTSLPVKPRPIPLGKPNAAGMAERAGAGLQRVSPGMYRNQQGDLVGSKGQALPGQRPQQQRPMPPQQQNVGNMLAGAAQGANQFQPQQPATRPPMPYGQGQEPEMMYTGGTPNFNEMYGQYNNQFQSGFGAKFDGQFNPAMQMNPQQQVQQQAFAQQQMGQLQPPMGQYGYGRQMPQEQQQYNTGFGDYLRSRAAQMPPAQQNMQPQQGIVAPPPGTPNNGNIY